MRMISDLRKHDYVLGVSLLLAVVALTVGIAGCDSAGNNSYTLTITSTAGGSVTDPGEGTFSYEEGAVVNLVATPEEGYAFQGWTGDTEGVVDPGSGTTSVTMGQDFSIRADFSLAGSHGPGTP